MRLCPLRAARMRVSLRLLLVFFLALPCAQALAIDALVLVSSGAVNAIRTGADGRPVERALRASDEVNAGDQLNTGSDGRVQLRFTDGAIISLQPGSQFRIDEYRYQGNSQRGFFSLIRGALRTTSGAIGKRDPRDYEMRTPTATIGIRGTEYIAEFTVCDPVCAPGPLAGLRVAVSEGIVSIANPAGEIQVAAGQAGGANSLTGAPSLIDSRPTLQPRTLNLQTLPRLAQSSSSNERQAGNSPSSGGIDPNNSMNSALGATEIADRSNPLTAPYSISNETRVSPSGVPSLNGLPSANAVLPDRAASKQPAASSIGGPRSMESRPNAASPTPIITDGLATKDGQAKPANSKSATNSNSQVSSTPATSSTVDALALINSDILNRLLAPGTAFTSSGSGSSSGSSSSSDTAAYSSPQSQGYSGAGARSFDESITATPLSGFPNPTYRLREPAVAQSVDNVRGSSSNRGQTVAESVDPPADQAAGIGSPVVSAIDLYRDTNGNILIARADDKACLSANDCAGASAPGTSNAGSTSSGSTSSGSTDSGSSGSVSSDSGTSGSGSTGSGSTGLGSSGSGSSGSGSGSGAPTLTPGPISSSSVSLNLRGVPVLNTLSLASANSLTTLDAERRLQSVGACPSLLCLSRGTAFYAETETASDAYVSWGRWKSGAVDLRILGIPASINLSYWQGLHYLVGVPTLLMPTTGSFSYSLTGATLATTSDGSVAPGTLSAAAVVQFGSGSATRVGIQGSVAFSNSSLQFSSNGGTNNVAGSNLNMTSANTFSGLLVTTQTGTGPVNCATSGCTTQLRGGFYGPDAARMGIDYSITGSGSNRTINGVGVFTKQ